MNLSTILLPSAVFARLRVRDKKQALKLLAQEAAALTNIGEREIYSVLMAREHLGCTGMGGGVSIPHGRFDNLTGLHLLAATIEEPIDFGAADGKKVDILCLLMTPADANTEHLKALASVSRLLRDKDLCAKIRAAADAPAIYQLLIEKRSEI